MGYKKEYIIDPEIKDDEQPIVEKEMEPVYIPSNQISRDYEVINETGQSKSVYEEIHEAAVEEGLVDENEEPIGGEGAKPQEVIDALRNKDRSEGAKKNFEEYAENKINKTKKIMATREILTGMTKRFIDVTVPVVLDVRQNDGSVKPELIDLDLKVQRLTESQVNHLFNRRMAGKEVKDMTEEELQEDNHFRSKFLEATVVEPQMDADTWYNDVPAVVTGTIFNTVNDVLSQIDNTELFQ